MIRPEVIRPTPPPVLQMHRMRARHRADVRDALWLGVAIGVALSWLVGVGL